MTDSMGSRLLTRRTFIAAGGAALAAPSIPRAAPAPRWKSNPFSLGVASGSPAPDGFVLWTRLAPEPDNYDAAGSAGMHGGPVGIGYEIATDADFKKPIRHGTALADPNFAYSVHAEIRAAPIGIV